jgi:hypothetical protein
MKHMKHRNSFEDHNQTPTGPVRVATSEVLDQKAMSFVPSPDEVARKAYFAYENEGSRPGRDVQHWLSAEADLIAERNQTRTHGAHNQT